MNIVQLNNKLDKNKVTLGTPYKTGRIIDNKIEYGLIFDVGTIPSTNSKTVTLPVDLSDCIVTNYYIAPSEWSANNETTIFPTANAQSPNSSVRVALRKTNIFIRTFDATFSGINAWAYIYYLK